MEDVATEQSNWKDGVSGGRQRTQLPGLNGKRTLPDYGPLSARVICPTGKYLFTTGDEPPARIGRGRKMTSVDFQVVAMYTDLSRRDIGYLQSIARVYDVTQMRELIQCRLNHMAKKKRCLDVTRHEDYNVYGGYLQKKYGERMPELMPLMHDQTRPPKAWPRVNEYPDIRNIPRLSNRPRRDTRQSSIGSQPKSSAQEDSAQRDSNAAVRGSEVPDAKSVRKGRAAAAKAEQRPGAEKVGRKSEPGVPGGAIGGGVASTKRSSKPTPAGQQKSLRGKDAEGGGAVGVSSEEGSEAKLQGPSSGERGGVTRKKDAAVGKSGAGKGGKHAPRSKEDEGEKTADYVDMFSRPPEDGETSSELMARGKTKAGKAGDGKSGVLRGDEVDAEGRYAGEKVDAEGRYAGGKVDAEGRYTGGKVDAEGRYAGDEVDAEGRYAGGKVDAEGRYVGGKVDAEGRYADEKSETPEIAKSMSLDDVEGIFTPEYDETTGQSSRGAGKGHAGGAEVRDDALQEDEDVEDHPAESRRPDEPADEMDEATMMRLDQEENLDPEIAPLFMFDGDDDEKVQVFPAVVSSLVELDALNTERTGHSADGELSKNRPSDGEEGSTSGEGGSYHGSKEGDSSRVSKKGGSSRGKKKGGSSRVSREGDSPHASEEGDSSHASEEGDHDSSRVSKKGGSSRGKKKGGSSRVSREGDSPHASEEGDSSHASKEGDSSGVSKTGGSSRGKKKDGSSHVSREGDSPHASEEGDSSHASEEGDSSGVSKKGGSSRGKKKGGSSHVSREGDSSHASRDGGSSRDDGLHELTDTSDTQELTTSGDEEDEDDMDYDAPSCIF